ncbi:unnamed protein product [Bemisia tabaci]|uniref:GPI inositol-deacylase n=2 Tax=Bemisia tabaci TaxID=7038 RepID=A0A9P0C921_BEMTA|nr:unnamed protein product [Bemisia tabaci]
MLPFSKFVIVSAVVFIAYIAGLYRFLTHFDENKCGMTYMYGYPTFVDVPVTRSVSRGGWGEGRSHENYRLYLYAEGRFVEKVRHLRLTGIPVLFIPGNGGSYRQVRSLASISLHKGLDLKAPYHFNFFGLDLNEEYSALFGGVLKEQTQFAQDSIRTILSLYPSFKPPPSIILVGHSMGGIIAKGLMIDEAFDAAATIKVIVTLASPHTPILLLDSYLADYYREIDLHWQKKTQNVTLISIGGGNRDLHVRGALTHESSADVDVLGPSIPGVWKSTDHLCILWCKSLVKVINRAFFDVIDTTSMGVHRNDAVRAEIFKYHLQQRSDGKHFHQDLHPPSLKLDPAAKWVEKRELRFRYAEKEITKTTYLLLPTTNFKSSQFDKLTIDAENLKSTDWIFLCQANENRNGKYCLFGENLSKNGYIMPTLTQKRKQILISASDINLDFFTHIIVKISATNDPVSLSVDFHNSNERTLTTPLPSLVSFGRTLITATEPGAVTYSVQIPNLENEVQAGYLHLKSVKCNKQRHYAILQMKVPWSQESTHSFSSYKKQVPLFLKLYRSKPSGDASAAAVSLTLDPDCAYTVSIESSVIDFLASVGQIYSPLLIPNIVGILLLTLSAQMMNLALFESCSMYHNVLVVGAQPVKTLCITNIVTYVLSVLGVVPAVYYQLSLASMFYFTVGFAILYIIGVGLWYSLVFSTNKISDIVLSFLARYLGSLTWSEWILSGLEQLPVIVSAVLIGLVNSTCGGLALSLGAIFYYLKLCSLYEDFLNYYIYYPFRYIINQLKARLSWKSNTELKDMWRKNLPPNVDDDANDLTPLHFHFTIFLLWAALAILNVPSTLMWAHNFQHSVHLEPDPSWLPGIALSLSAAAIWPGSCPDSGIKHYREISILIYILACVSMVFCHHTIYYLQYIISTAFVIIAGHQLIGRYFARKAIEQEQEQLTLTEDNPSSETLCPSDQEHEEIAELVQLLQNSAVEEKFSEQAERKGNEKLEPNSSSVGTNEFETEEVQSSGSSTESFELLDGQNILNPLQDSKVHEQPVDIDNSSQEELTAKEDTIETCATVTESGDAKDVSEEADDVSTETEELSSSDEESTARIESTLPDSNK